MKNIPLFFIFMFVSAIVSFGCSKTNIDDGDEEVIPEYHLDSVYLFEHFDNFDGLDSKVAHSISVLKSLDVHFERIGTLDHSEGHTYNQGCSVYDGVLFQCYHSNDIIDLISIDDLKREETILLEPETIIHCNNVNFGGRKVRESDPFPVLYIQQRGYASTLNVYRILYKQGFYDASLIQTITFKECKSSVSAVDTKNNLFYIFYNTGEDKIIACYDIPSFSKESITIDLSKERKNRPRILQLTKVTQDMVFVDHFLFISSGYAGEGELWIIDVTSGVARMVNLVDNGLKAEPEGLTVYDGQLYLVMSNFNCYSLDVTSLFSNS